MQEIAKAGSLAGYGLCCPAVRVIVLPGAAQEGASLNLESNSECVSADTLICSRLGSS